MALFGRKKKDDAPVVDPVEPIILEGAPAPREDGRRSLAEHRAFLLERVEPLMPFGVSLLDGAGLTLCEDLSADQDLPAADLSRIDGVAVRAADVAHATSTAPARLFLAAELDEGDRADGEMRAGECVRLLTGGYLPIGADAVVPMESCVFLGEDVDIVAPVRAKENVRATASIVADGEVLLRKGSVLDSRTAAKVAAAGIDRVIIRPRPRVVVLAAGARLLDANVRMRKDADVYDVNSYLVATAAKLDGAQVWRVPIHTSDPDELRNAINDQMIRADLLVVTCGAGRDDADMIGALLPTLGPTDIADVAVQPSRPQFFTLMGAEDAPLVWLSGDPAEAYSGYLMTVRPLLRKLMDREPFLPKPSRAVTSSVVRSTKGSVNFVPAIVRDEGSSRVVVTPLQDTDANVLSDLSAANAFIVLDEDRETVVAGQVVPVILLDED